MVLLQPQLARNTELYLLRECKTEHKILVLGALCFKCIAKKYKQLSFFGTNSGKTTKYNSLISDTLQEKSLSKNEQD